MPSPPTSTILITGANGGLGAGIVSQFLASPHATTTHALYCVCDVPSASRLRQLLFTAHKSSLPYDILPLDLSSLAGVRAAAESINARVQAGALPPLRAVVLNAATQRTRGSVAFTPHDGIEANLAVNYLANVLLVLLLLPSLWRGDTGRGARVVVVSSWAHDADDWKNRKFITAQRFRGRNVELDLNALAEGAKSLAGGSSWAYGKRRYGVSKLLLIMFM
jgi:NAD(P)-dependent dehydrogenase (short-subunit alcohol dehydrogenase family)